MLPFSLRSEGFDATEVTTGSEALESLERDLSDAAVLDVQFPNGQGRAVLDWLRQRPPLTRRGRVWVVISALDCREGTKRYSPLGNHFLVNPVDPSHWGFMLHT
jgi:CheY-like chemotaxis protein